MLVSVKMKTEKIIKKNIKTYENYPIKGIKYFDLNPVVRNNTTSMLISGNIKNQKELEQISFDMADTFGGQDKFNEMMAEVRKEPYNWLYLRLDKQPPEAYKNFQQRLF